MQKSGRRRTLAHTGKSSHNRKFVTPAEEAVYPRYVIFQMAEVAVPRDLFADILRRIDRLRPNVAPVRREQSTAARIV